LMAWRRRWPQCCCCRPRTAWSWCARAPHDVHNSCAGGCLQLRCRGAF
jgi:hypothetical protein